MVTLTGTFTRLDGSPASGTVRVTPSRSPIMDPDGKIVISGPQTFPLDADGTLSVQIPASNDPDLGPAFTYAIDVNLTHASWKISKVWIPHGSTTVDLSEIGDYQPVPGVATRVVTIPADGTDGQVLVWDGAGFAWDYPPEGPQGPPGEVTTAALTTALAGKVTGTGLTLRHDTTVGTRVLLDHPGGTTMLTGDTGWRNIDDLVNTGEAAPGQPTKIRRINDQIYFTLRRDAVTIGTATTIITLPSGWYTGSANERRYTSGAQGNSALLFRINGVPSGLHGTVQPMQSGIDNASLYLNASWATTLPWPTTLPGIPA